MKPEDIDFLLLFVYVLFLSTIVTAFLSLSASWENLDRLLMIKDRHGKKALLFMAGGLAVSLVLWPVSELGGLGVRLFGGTLFIIACMSPVAFLAMWAIADKR